MEVCFTLTSRVNFSHNLFKILGESSNLCKKCTVMPSIVLLAEKDEQTYINRLELYILTRRMETWSFFFSEKKLNCYFLNMHAPPHEVN